MRTSLLGIIGLIIFISCLSLNSSLSNGEKTAFSLDDEETAFGIIEGPPPCVWTVESPERVMSENESQAIVVQATNSTNEECESTLSLSAPSFNLSPLKGEQKLVLAQNGTGSTSWILTPQKTGTYELSVSDVLNTQIYGVTVTNTFGLTALQAKFASGIGTFFGPMITVPWWWDRFRQRKQKQEN